MLRRILSPREVFSSSNCKCTEALSVPQEPCFSQSDESLQRWVPGAAVMTRLGITALHILGGLGGNPGSAPDFRFM